MDLFRRINKESSIAKVSSSDLNKIKLEEVIKKEIVKQETHSPSREYPTSVFAKSKDFPNFSMDMETDK